MSGEPGDTDPVDDPEVLAAEMMAALGHKTEGGEGGDGAGKGLTKSQKKRLRKKKKKMMSSGAGAGEGAGEGAAGEEDTPDLEEPEEPEPAAAPVASEPDATLVSRLEAEAKEDREVVDTEGTKALKAKLKDEARKTHAFWDKQPMLGFKDEADGSDSHCPLEADKPVEEIREEPYNLPKAYEWVSVDVTDDEQLTEVYELLAENYVEDDDSMFRFAYPKEFLKWALLPPEYYKDWHVGVRAVSNGKLYGFISGTPAHIHMYHEARRMCEINFLCVHKRLRSKRLAPVLIKEVTRRVNRRGMFQAVYTAGVVLPRPVSACQYWHRSINPKKLIEIGFSHLNPRMTMARTTRLFKLPAATLLPNFQRMTPAHVPQACALLRAYLKRFQLWPNWNEDEFAHWMLPREGVIDSFVVLDDEGRVTDLCSYYHLPSQVIGNDKYKTLRAVYSFYNVPGKHSLQALMKDALIMAKNQGADVFNALDLQENKSVFKDLKFGPGDGHLHYYLYNWKCPTMDASGVGLVLQ